MPVAAAATYLLSDLLSHFLSVPQLDLSEKRRLGRLESYGLESNLRSEPVRYVACVCNVTSRAHAQSTICVRPLRFVYKGYLCEPSEPCGFTTFFYVYLSMHVISCVCVCACVLVCMRASVHTCVTHTISHSEWRHLYISTPDAKKTQFYIFAGKNSNAYLEGVYSVTCHGYVSTYGTCHNKVSLERPYECLFLFL